LDFIRYAVATVVAQMLHGNASALQPPTVLDGTMGWVMAQYVDITGDLSWVLVIADNDAQSGAALRQTSPLAVSG
jgi:hypothetical protein